MIKINFPGSVVHNVPFTWSIDGAPAGTTWTARVWRGGTEQGPMSGTVGASGRFVLTAQTIAAGSYVFDYTLSDGTQIRVPVQCFAEYTFPWRPEFGGEVAKSPQVHSIKFGDGYTQDFAKGINNNPKNWSLTFGSLSDMEARQIMEFLDRMGGSRSFYWTDIDGLRNKYKCKTYSRTPTRVDDNSVRATFEQSFI